MWEIAELCYQAGASINESHNGMYLIHHAAYNGSCKFLQIAIENGADINLKSEYSLTPLILATIELDNPALEFLIKAGADLNLTDDVD